MSRVLVNPVVDSLAEVLTRPGITSLVLMPGVHYVPATLTINIPGLRISGQEGAILEGSLPLTGWTNAGGDIWTTTIPVEHRRHMDPVSWSFVALPRSAGTMVYGAQMSVWPTEGAATVTSVTPSGADSIAQFGQALPVMDASSRVGLFWTYDWRYFLETPVPQSGGLFRTGTWTVGDRVRIYNFKNGLQPGTYAIDWDTGQVRFRGTPTNLRYSVLRDAMIRVNADNVRISNLTLRHGMLDAIRVTANSCRLTDLTISDFGAAGISGIGDDIVVSRCTVRDCGEWGVILENQESALATLVGSNRIDRCEISNVGWRAGTQRPALSLGRAHNHGVSVRGSISNCRIFNVPHHAIFVNGPLNVVRDTVISDCCVDTSDAGAVYMGRNYFTAGCTFERITVTGLVRRTGRGWSVVGLYFDDLISNARVSACVVEGSGTFTKGVLVGGGSNVSVNGVTCIGLDDGVYWDARGTQPPWDVSLPVMLATYNTFYNGLTAQQQTAWARITNNLHTRTAAQLATPTGNRQGFNFAVAKRPAMQVEGSLPV